MSWLLPVPWGWFTDPLWLTLGNLLFWPAVFLHAYGMDKWEEWRRVRNRR